MTCFCYKSAGFVFAEIMTSRIKQVGGYQLRNRSLLPRPLKTRKSIPRSLINITEPMKAGSLIKHFKARMQKMEARKVITRIAVESNLLK